MKDVELEKINKLVESPKVKKEIPQSTKEQIETDEQIPLN